MIRIEKVNEVFVKVYCEADIAFELNEYFTFAVPGAKFSPAFKNKVWDGKIRLFNTMTRQIYAGLIPHIQKFSEEREYDVEVDQSLQPKSITSEDIQPFLESLNLKFQPRDYQIEAVCHAINHSRGLLLSPTASGKSFIIYLLTRYYWDLKTLIIVPTISLVHQMAKDFADYGYEEDIHRITSGVDKQTDCDVVITTWQSIYKMPKKWFDQFGVTIGDEAHNFKAKSLTSIMTKLPDCKYRFGFTGTLDGTLTNKLVLEGLFGAVKKVTTTSVLIEQKHLSDFRIKALVLKYPDEIRKQLKTATYQDEMDYIVRCDARNKFIKDLVFNLKGNTLLLFQYVDKHGKVLYNMFEQEHDNVHFVHGGVGGIEREEIRKLAEEQEDMIIIASYGTFSTGINIKNLHNIVFASPSKSRIRNLQSIGRGLRKSNTKDIATLYDISDDLTWKSHKNHTILHFAERIKIYNEEKFDYKIYQFDLKV
jgi:superfamily II DNA or RNA helicase